MSYVPNALGASFGSFHLVTTADTALTAGVSAKMEGTTTPKLLRNFTSTDNRLTYTGTRIIEVLVLASIAVEVSTTNTTIECGFACDGALVSQSIVPQYFSSAADTQVIGISCLGTMYSGYYGELWARSDKNTTLTSTHFAFTIIEVGIVG